MSLPPDDITFTGLVDGVYTTPEGPPPEEGDYTFTVSGFGTRSSAASFFEDFEALSIGAAGNSPGSIEILTADGATISNARSYSGTKSLLNSYATQYFPHVYVALSGTKTKFYASCRCYISGSLTGSGVYKMWRIGSPTENVYGGEPRAGESWQSSSTLPDGFAGEIVTSAGVTSWADQNQATPGAESIINLNEWQFYEFEFYTGTIDNSDCYFRVMVNGTPIFIWNNRNYLTTANSQLPDWLLLPYQGIDGSPAAFVNWDDIYCDDGSRARVIFTDNATYVSSTKFDVQPITSYSATSISVTKNTPSFTDGVTAYVHAWSDTGSYQYLGTQVV
jgi:hypothetical protein